MGMIPDKIYVASGTTGIGGLCGLWFADMESDLPQYIRKDALLEWVREYLDLKIYDTKRAVMEELIDKLNSM